MIQSGGIQAGSLASIPQVMFHKGLQAFKKIAPELTEIATENVITLKRFDTIMINSCSISNRCSYSKEFFWIGDSARIISNEKMEDMMKIVKSLDESGLLIKGVSETTQKKAKEQKVEFIGM